MPISRCGQIYDVRMSTYIFIVVTYIFIIVPWFFRRSTLRCKKKMLVSVLFTANCPTAKNLTAIYNSYLHIKLSLKS